MINKQFLGVMTKHTHAYIDNEVFVKIGIKHTDVGDIQTFLSSFEEKLSATNVKSLFEYPVRWKKIVIDTSDYEKNTFLVGFDEIEFDAQLQEIHVTRKNRHGLDSFEYTLHFLKEVGRDNEDSTIAKTYLKYKEENEEGKLVIKEFPVDLELLDEVNTHTPEIDTF
jgi:hypothetical protein